MNLAQRLLTGTLLSLTFCSACMAQNVTGYGGMSEPLLFLLREPAVHDELKLTQIQRGRLTNFNHTFDSSLLASRNQPAKRSQAAVNEALTAAREQIAELLTSAQQKRLQQIKYRLRGIRFVQLTQVADQLQLDERQKNEIEDVINEAQKAIQENSNSTFPGKAAYQKAQKAIAAARKQEQEQVFAVLSEKQQQQLYGLIGPNFDASRLGRVSFKAPEFSRGDQWINSDALKIEDFRGKVVALHFYAFG